MGVDALFLGAWERDLGIAELSEALFLVRDRGRDLLWSLTTDAVKFTHEAVAARARGIPYSVDPKWTCGCVAGAPRRSTEREGGTVLLSALARARIPHDFPRRPYLPGVLTTEELADIVGTVGRELEANTSAAETGPRDDEAPILKLARELDLHPRPAGHNPSAWTADCPRRSHSIMISPSLNEFGCGYYRRKGGPAELQKFSEYVESPGRST